jgi:2',3'-cyclic-nucleotide 2'-phosphodiesterase
MNILILGDIMGLTGFKAVKNNLKKIIQENRVDFTIINGENACDDGKGITKEIADELFNIGADVITSGNHIFDKQETVSFIKNENRLLRPANMVDGTPGKGFDIFLTKNQNFKIAVINLMGNVFMRKTSDVFQKAKSIIDKIVLKKDADFIVVDFHGETTSEKMALAHFLDGRATCLIGTHTHVPTADTRILERGTAFQTDIGMCGDYNSVIGMNKENSIMKFFKDKNATQHFPATGDATLSGVLIEANEKDGLALNIKRFLLGGDLKK